MPTPLKEYVDGGVVRELARRFAADERFDADAFVAATEPHLDALELKARIELIARELRAALGGDDLHAIAAVVAVARAEPPVDGWAAWPLPTVIELFGLDHPVESLAAMEHVTKRMSCEFAVRPFLRDHFDLAYAQLEAFTAHPDERVRRLPSEGTRPRLPWGMRVRRLVDDPVPGIALLARLRHDPSEDVRRSVANHLNDIAKDHPALVVDTAADWLQEPDTDRRMVAHALRTLVKRGEPAALAALGFATDADVEVGRFDVTPQRVAMGDHITLRAELTSTSDESQRLVVDFVIHHVNASGETSPKVFKWTTLDLAAGEHRSLSKRRLIQHASTRRYHAGAHRVELQIAGTVVAATSFDVLP